MKIDLEWSPWYSYSDDKCPLPIGTHCALKIYEDEDIYYVEDIISEKTHASEAWKIRSSKDPRVIFYRYKKTYGFKLLESLL